MEVWSLPSGATRLTAFPAVCLACLRGEPGWWVPSPDTRRKPIHGDSGATSMLLTVPGDGTHHPDSWYLANFTHGDLGQGSSMKQSSRGSEVPSFRTVRDRDVESEFTWMYLQRVLKGGTTLPWRPLNIRKAIHFPRPKNRQLK